MDISLIFVPIAVFLTIYIVLFCLPEQYKMNKSHSGFQNVYINKPLDGQHCIYQNGAWRNLT